MPILNISEINKVPGLKKLTNHCIIVANYTIKVKRISFIIFFFSPFSIIAQVPETAIINGYINDVETGETLIGCYIMDSVSNRGVITNSFGYFNLVLNKGKGVISTHYIGYNKYTINMDITKDTTIVIQLKSKQFELGEVLIQGYVSGPEAKLSSPQMGMMNMTSKEVRKLPVLFGADVMRSIQVLPGIQAPNERSTGISVRGGSIDQNLFLLDDALIFQISHVGGFFSVFNNDAVKDIKIYKGDIPANYGGRISSVVDIRLKDGNMQKYKIAGGIGLLAADLSMEGPMIKDRMSFIVSGKYGGWGGLGASIAPGLSMSFYDLNIKLNAILNDKNRLYLSSYYGGDNVMFLRSKYYNNTLSLRWNHVYTSKLFSNISFVYSNYTFQNGTKNKEFSYTWQSGVKQVTLKAEYNFYINNNHQLDFGASVSYNNFIPGKLEGNQREIDKNNQSIKFNHRAIEEQGVLDYALFASNNQSISDKLSLRYGIRASLYQNLGGHWVYKLNDTYQVADSFYVKKNETYANYYRIEPRISLNYRIFNNSAIKASYTYMTQQTQLLVKTNGGGPLDVWFPSGVNIKPQLSSQYSLGFIQFLFGNSLELNIEGYYKDMRNIIDYKDGATFLAKSNIYTIDNTNYNFEEQIRTGRGKAYGIELMVKGKYKKTEGFVNYTYSRSKRKIPGINQGGTYLSPFDKPHTFDLFLCYNKSQRLSFSTNLSLQSGQVATVPIYTMIMYGKVLSGYSSRNEYRLPSYQRLDISLTLKDKDKPDKKYHGEWNFSIINVLNHGNISHINFVQSDNHPETVEAKGIYFLGIIPSVSYRFNF